MSLSFIIIFSGSATQRGLWVSRFTRFCDHTQRCATVVRNSRGRMISSSQRPLPDITQNTQQKNIHAPGGIRTHDRIRRAALDLRLRPALIIIYKPFFVLGSFIFSLITKFSLKQSRTSLSLFVFPVGIIG
jgi:hypothetical protein